MALYLGYDRVATVKVIKVKVLPNLTTVTGTYKVVLNNSIGDEVEQLKLNGKYGGIKGNMFDKTKFAKVSDFPIKYNNYYNYAYIEGLKPNTEYTVAIHHKDATTITSVATVFLLSGSTFSVTSGQYTVIAHYSSSAVGNTTYTTDDTGRLTIGIYTSGTYAMTDEKLTQIWSNTDIVLVESSLPAIASPDTPIAVSGVGDRTKNLLDLSGEIFGAYSTRLTREGNSIIATSTAKNQYQNSKIKVPDIPAGTTVTLSAVFKASSSNVGRVLFAYYDASSKATTTIAILDNSGSSVTATIPSKTSETQVLCLILYSNLNGTTVSGDTVTYSNIQIEEGNKKTDYEPYGYKIPVVTAGKNLVDLPDTTREGRGETNGFWVLYPNTKAGTYTFSADVKVENYEGTGNMLAYGFQCEGDTNNTYGTYLRYPQYNGEGRYSFSFTAPNKLTFFYVYIHSGCTSGQITLSNQMLTVDDDDTTFEAYKTPIVKTIYTDRPLLNLLDVTDTLDYKNKTMSTRIVKMVLDGSEAWNMNTNVTGVNRFYFTPNNPIAWHTGNSGLTNMVLCSHFDSNNSINKGNNQRIKNIATSYSSQIWFYTDATKFPDLATWKAWLAENKVELYYKSAEIATDIAVDTPKIYTEDVKTNIEIGTEVKPDYLEVSYWEEAK